MSQNELSQMVFTFSEKHTDLLDSKDDFTEIQEVLKNCKLFKNLELKLIPRYKFFQIKKSQTEVEKDHTRFTI